jgi:cytochrome c
MAMRILGVAVLLIAASSQAALAQDPDKGKQVFAICMACHRIGPGATTLVGPELNGLNGRHSGSVPDYPYSDANKNSGIVWTEDEFKKYIHDPQGVVPGTKMLFAGIKNNQMVNDLWAYVSQFDADGNIKK